MINKIAERTKRKHKFQFFSTLLNTAIDNSTCSSVFYISIFSISFVYLIKDANSITPYNH